MSNDIKVEILFDDNRVFYDTCIDGIKYEARRRPAPVYTMGSPDPMSYSQRQSDISGTIKNMEVQINQDYQRDPGHSGIDYEFQKVTFTVKSINYTTRTITELRGCHITNLEMMMYGTENTVIASNIEFSATSLHCIEIKEREIVISTNEIIDMLMEMNNNG